jgi:hypothetical protein
VIPTLISNAESQVQQGLNSTAVSLPDPWSKPLPGLAGPQRSGRLRHISFTPDGVDLSLAMPPASDPSAPPLATIKPTSFPASVRAAIGLSVIVRDDLLKVASSLTVAWTVRRKDTNEVIASATKAYLDPVGNGLIMQHHSAALYHVDEYDVRCSVRLTLGNQTGCSLARPVVMVKPAVTKGGRHCRIRSVSRVRVPAAPPTVEPRTAPGPERRATPRRSIPLTRRRLIKT